MNRTFVSGGGLLGADIGRPAALVQAPQLAAAAAFCPALMHARERRIRSIGLLTGTAWRGGSASLHSALGRVLILSGSHPWLRRFGRGGDRHSLVAV